MLFTMLLSILDAPGNDFRISVVLGGTTVGIVIRVSVCIMSTYRLEP